jgi:hypothetical protein
MARFIPNARLHIFNDGYLGLTTSVDQLAPAQVREIACHRGAARWMHNEAPFINRQDGAGHADIHAPAPHRP